MKRFMGHLLQIFVLGIILILMLNVPLYKVPYLQGIILVLIFVLLGIWTYLSFLKRSPKMKGKKRKFLFLSLGVILFSLPCQADPFCQLAETYHERAFYVNLQNGKGDAVDIPCEEDDWEEVREKLDKLSEAPPVFKPSDKLSSEQMNKWRSFRQDSHWPQWVEEKYNNTAEYLKLGTTAEEMACAAVFESLCSEYERRHPDTRAKTVTQIMQKNVVRSRNNRSSGCWPCKMAYIILVVVQRMSSDLEESMREAGLNILKILMLLWILYAAFLAVVFPSKGQTFVKDLLTRMFCVMIAAVILSSGDTLQSLYSSVLSPIIDLGLGISEGISDSVNDSFFSFAEEVRAGTGVSSIETNLCNVSMTESYGTDNNPWSQMIRGIFPDLGTAYPRLGGTSDGLITPELQANLLCLTQKMYRQVSPITAIGQSLISFSIADGKTYWKVTFPVWRMWFVGLALTVMFSVFSFLVAFKIIDIFLRMGFILVLMPIFVATWAFPKTRDFTQKGFMFLLSIVTEFFGLTLALTFIMVSFESGITENKSALVSAMIAPYSENYGKNLYNVIVSNGGWYFFFMLVALFFIGTQILSCCTKVIGSFFGTSAAAGLGGDITGAVAVAGLQQTAQKVWKPASNIGKNVKPYKVENGKSGSYLVGRMAGRMTSGQNPLKDLGESNSPATSKRYFGQKTGNGIDRASQYLAAGIDKIGVGVGQGLSKTGVGAVVGVPLTLATKTLSVGVRATGKLASVGVKATGATLGAVKNTFKDPKGTIKNGVKAVQGGIKGVGQGIKNGVANVGNKILAAPRKVVNDVKKGFSDGKK